MHLCKQHYANFKQRRKFRLQMIFFSIYATLFSAHRRLGNQTFSSKTKLIATPSSSLKFLMFASLVCIYTEHLICRSNDAIRPTFFPKQKYGEKTKTEYTNAHNLHPRNNVYFHQVERNFTEDVERRTPFVVEL